MSHRCTTWSSYITRRPALNDTCAITADGAATYSRQCQAQATEKNRVGVGILELLALAKVTAFLESSSFYICKGYGLLGGEVVAIGKLIYIVPPRVFKEQVELIRYARHPWNAWGKRGIKASLVPDKPQRRSWYYFGNLNPTILGVFISPGWLVGWFVGC